MSKCGYSILFDSYCDRARGDYIQVNPSQAAVFHLVQWYLAPQEVEDKDHVIIVWELDSRPSHWPWIVKYPQLSQLNHSG